MVIFGVETDKSKIVKKFILDTNKRLNNNEMVKNPFVGYSKTFHYSGKYHVIKMSPLMPNLAPWIASFSFMVLVLFTPWPWVNSVFMIVPLFFWFFSIFWTEAFFYMVFKIGVKKAGYHGRVKKIKKNKLIDLLIRRI